MRINFSQRIDDPQRILYTTGDRTITLLSEPFSLQECKYNLSRMGKQTVEDIASFFDLQGEPQFNNHHVMLPMTTLTLPISLELITVVTGNAREKFVHAPCLGIKDPAREDLYTHVGEKEIDWEVPGKWGLRKKPGKILVNSYDEIPSVTQVGRVYWEMPAEARQVERVLTLLRTRGFDTTVITDRAEIEERQEEVLAYCCGAHKRRPTLEDDLRNLPRRSS